jgi:alkylhydroperoxidase/carboxymuconolactone decarboxylase family protein YurZ
MLGGVGFLDAQLVVETGFDSSPATKGALFRAQKPSIVAHRTPDSQPRDLFEGYKEFFNEAYAGGAIDRKTKHLIALGASLAAGCEP